MWVVLAAWAAVPFLIVRFMLRLIFALIHSDDSLCSRVERPPRPDPSAATDGVSAAPNGLARVAATTAEQPATIAIIPPGRGIA